MNEKPETITITMEEYKELLIIKGRYEELKDKQVQAQPIIWREPTYNNKEWKPDLNNPTVTFNKEVSA